MIYLDYAANTPVDEEVLEAFNNATRKYIANPNSSHPLGIKAREEIDNCSTIVAKYFNTDKENVIYTSGSSESNNLVIKGVAERYKNKGNHIIISELEHSSVVAPVNYLSNNGYDVTVIGLNNEGLVDIDKLKSAITDKTILVSICSVDSELGTIQPVEEIAKIVKEYPNCIFHTDATQAIGKVNIDFSNIDFVTFAPHKFFGLNGFGALINRNNIKINPIIHGGKSTTIYRSGTPVTANVVALTKALTLAIDNLDNRYKYLTELNNILREELSKLEKVHINSPLHSIPNTLNISFIGISNEDVLSKLEENEIYVSTTTACSLGNMPSKAVLALTNNEDLANNTMRISMSHLTTKEDINKFLDIFKNIVK